MTDPDENLKTSRPYDDTRNAARPAASTIARPRKAMRMRHRFRTRRMTPTRSSGPPDDHRLLSMVALSFRGRELAAHLTAIPVRFFTIFPAGGHAPVAMTVCYDGRRG